MELDGGLLPREERRTRSSASRTRTCASRRSRPRERGRGPERAPQAPQDTSAAPSVPRTSRTPPSRRSVISNPVSQFDQTMSIAAGRTSGIHVYDAVDHRGRPRRPGDEGDSATRPWSRCSPTRRAPSPRRTSRPGAIGIVRHSQGPEDLLFLDRVFKEQAREHGRRRRHRRQAVQQEALVLLPSRDSDRTA